MVQGGAADVIDWIVTCLTWLGDMVKGGAADVIDWIVACLAGMGEQAEDLAREAINWLQGQGLDAYALGVGLVLVWILVALWYSSRRG